MTRHHGSTWQPGLVFGPDDISRFELARPRMRGHTGSVTLHDDGVAWLEHSLLTAPLVVPVADIAAVVTLGDGDVEPREPARLPRLLHLPSGLQAPNVELVFRRPIWAAHFRRGADRVLAISPKERRRGLAIDGLVFTVSMPSELAATFRGAGVPWVSSIATAHAATFGVAAPEVAAEREAERAQAQRRAHQTGVFSALMVGAAVSLALGSGVDAEPASMLRIVVAGMAATVLIGAILATMFGSWTPRGRSPFRRLDRFAVMVGLLAIVPVSRRLLAGVAGPHLVVWLGALAGVAGGVVLALILVTGRTLPPTVPPVGPLADRALGSGGPTSRWVISAGVALVAMVGAAAGEPGSTQDLGRARTAVQVDDRLPEGWEMCCDGTLTLRGRALTQHLCAADDGLPRFEAAARRSFNLPTPHDDRFIDGHFEVTVRVAPSAADAAREMAAVDAAGYLDCTADLAERLSVTWQSRATGDAVATYEGRRPLSQVEGVIDTFRVRVPVGEVFDPSFVHLVRMQVGRSIVRVPVLVLTLEPPGLVDLDAILEVVLAQALDAGLADG